MSEQLYQFPVVDPASSEATLAMATYFAELDRRFELGFTAIDTDEELDAFRAPVGSFVIVTDGVRTLGCGGVRRLDAERAEIKRMWIDPSIRGHGVGRRLVGELEAHAVRLGCATMVLDTNATLSEAIGLYERAGYQSIERYNDNPDAQRWFRKQLS